MKQLLHDISKKIYFYCIITTVIMSFLLWVAQLLRYVNFITNINLSPARAFRITLWLIPESLGVAIPIAFALAIAIVYSRLRSTNQITAMFSMGCGYNKVLLPIRKTCFAIAWFFYLNVFFIAPICQHQFYSFKQEFNDSFILPQSDSVINYQNISFFIGKKSGPNTAYDVVVHDKRNKSRLSMLMANKADIMINKDKIVINLKDGGRVNVKDKNISKISFSEYQTSIDKKRSSSDKQYNEKMLHELLFSFAKRDQAILHQKMTTPICMMLSGLLVGLFMVMMEFTRKVNILPYIYACLAVAVLQAANVLILKIAMSSITANLLFYLFFLILLSNVKKYIRWL